MESIKNAASAASNAAGSLLGYNTTATDPQSGQEPVSGELGEGTAAEPYDSGNKDDGSAPQSTSAVTEAATTTQSGNEPVSGVSGTGVAVEPFDAGNIEGDKALGGQAPQDTAVPASIDRVGTPASTQAVKDFPITNKPTQSTELEPPAQPIKVPEPGTGTPSTGVENTKPAPATLSQVDDIKSAAPEPAVEDPTADTNKPLPEAPDAAAAADEGTAGESTEEKKKLSTKIKEKLKLAKNHTPLSH